MVGIGMLMTVVGLTSLYLRRKGRLYDSRRLLVAAMVMGPSGFIALLSGWVVTEVGRQPWTVYGLLRTADSVSPIGAPGVATSLAAFGVVYLTVFGAGFYFLSRLVAKPPMQDEPEQPPDMPIRTAGITPGLAGAVPGQPATGD
jgi:cytochrome d ubiquinol oxidase subunit I